MTMMILNVRRRPRRMRSWERGYHAKTRVYAFTAGQTILENLFARGTEPHREYRKLFTGHAALEEFAAHSPKWSRHAGCSMCPCSPGFILNDCLLTEKHVPYDIFIDVCDTADMEAAEIIGKFAQAFFVPPERFNDADPLAGFGREYAIAA